LCCELPAIILSDEQPIFAAPICYKFSQLQSLKKSALCLRRPAAADDPRVGRFAIWRSQSKLKRGCLQYLPNPDRKNDRGNNEDKTYERLGNQKHHYRRENGFIAPRYLRNYDFSNHMMVRDCEN